MEFIDLKGLLPEEIFSLLSGVKGLIEIRIRLGRSLHYLTTDCQTRKIAYTITQRDIDKIIAAASGFSLYSVEEQLAKGYLFWQGGVRIGVAGVGVIRGGELRTVKDISSLCIRIPSEVIGCANKIYFEYLNPKVPSTLIISKAGRGKTTLIRDISRLIGAKHNIVIVDERYEIAGINKILSTGELSDIISGVPKYLVYENVIRALNPEVIVFDELFLTSDIEAVVDAVRSGVKVIASVHAQNQDALERNKRFSPLLHCFELLVTLKDEGDVGIIESVTRLK